MTIVEGLTTLHSASRGQLPRIATALCANLKGWLSWKKSLLIFLTLQLTGLVHHAYAQQSLNQNCIVGILNRTVQVNADGTWILPNIPAGFGNVRARATCVENGVTTFGQSALFTIQPNLMNAIPNITLGPTTPIPTSIAISASSTSLTSAGATAQLTVTATYNGSPNQNVTASSTGTQYNVSNPAIATVSANGLVTALTTGTVAIQAVNEGAQGIISIQVVLAGVSHGGIPDSWAIAHGLDPNDPAMPSEDPDKDGLTNLQEFQAGTDPHNPDTDGDGLTDGQEVLIYHTNPLLFSTDGTGIPDGIEVKDGTLGGSLSAKLAGALASLTVSPSNFVLVVNTLEEQATQQLTVTGHLTDGKTTIDLTSTLKGTTYSSSDLTICNFGTPDGNVFAGAPGSCTITVRNGNFSAQATGTVTGFTPTDLAYLSIPGFTNGVAVNGNTVYIAAGSAGLQVVDVTNRTAPTIISALALTGNANGVRLVGNLAYVAMGTGGLQIVDVTNPKAPALVSTLATSGAALTLVVYGNIAYIADSTNLTLVNVANPANPAVLGSLNLSGTVEGVDVDPVRKLAVVAAGGGGLYVVDVSNPSALAVLGSTNTGEPVQVAIQNNIVYVADYTTSTNSVDITTPSNPVVLSHIADPNLGGYLQDILVNGHFALAADVKFFNGIPITDISVPSQLQARAILNFTQRDDNGMGIAADASYVYLVTEHSTLTKFGTSGDSRLYIGQYRPVEDLKGIPPTASITSPTNGTTVVQGSILPIIVNAVDDVAVASVNFLVNSQQVFTSTSYPYQFNYLVPTNATTLTLGATAVDFGGNIGTAKSVSVHAIPDPGTTIIGTVVDKTGAPVAGATVTFGALTTTSSAKGAFTLAGAPTVQGNIVVQATATIAGHLVRGRSAFTPPVLAGTTNVGNIRLSRRPDSHNRL